MPHAAPAIITALKEELAAVRAGIPADQHAQAVLLRGGVGWQSATRAANGVFTDATPSWLCSSGFCGALCDGLQVGDVVLASSIQCGDAGASAFALDAAFLSNMTAVLKAAGVKFHVGGLICTREPVLTREHKRALGERASCVAVDMESYAVAQAAAGRCPVFAIRSISDSVEDELPPQVSGFLNENGDVRFINVAKFALSSHRNIKTLCDLGARSKRAAAGLTAAWKALWPVVQRKVL
ncbi:MAG TPA: hypothetical protein VGP72_24780 [Planctomycetota bacterium]